MTDVSQSDDLASLVAGRIPVRNAWYLLLYAWDLAAWRGRWKAASEQSPSLLGLLARILTDATLDLLKRQLGRSYAPLSETICGTRGRIDFATSLKRLTFEQGAVHCTFSELTIDTLKNRILRATLYRLVSDPRLVSTKHLEEAELRHDLRSVVRAMDGVAFAPVTSTDFSRLQLGRND